MKTILIIIIIVLTVLVVKLYFERKQQIKINKQLIGIQNVGNRRLKVSSFMKATINKFLNRNNEFILHLDLGNYFEIDSYVFVKCNHISENKLVFINDEDKKSDLDKINKRLTPLDKYIIDIMFDKLKERYEKNETKSQHFRNLFDKNIKTKFNNKKQ